MKTVSAVKPITSSLDCLHVCVSYSSPPLTLERQEAATEAAEKVITTIR